MQAVHFMINAKRNEKNSRYIWSNSFFVIPLQPQISNYGTLADRLGNGLQNRVEQFDSARHLGSPKEIILSDFFIIHY